MINKLVLAGGTGFIGHILMDYFKDKANEILILNRQRQGKEGIVEWIKWDGRTAGEWVKKMEGTDLLVNLCGKNVNCRYTEKNKKAIFSSRLEPTELLGTVINTLSQPPKLWIQAASATIYRHAEDHPQDEAGGEKGSGFSVDVCKTWESLFWKQQTPHTRKVVLRIALVMGRSDGVIPRLKNMVLAGLGGKQGSGNQYIFWVHQQDLARIIEWLYDHPAASGTYNVSAPEAVQNHQFMKIMRQAIGVPFGLPSPQWLLELGAKIIGTETELILKSRWVYPKRLLEEGFTFQYPKAAPAIREILSTRT
ncbi:MAG TPA: TIGR01777 family oxidoreductase [Chitinophagaceae bacterium]